MSENDIDMYNYDNFDNDFDYYIPIENENVKNDSPKEKEIISSKIFRLILEKTKKQPKSKTTKLKKKEKESDKSISSIEENNTNFTKKKKFNKEKFDKEINNINVNNNIELLTEEEKITKNIEESNKPNFENFSEDKLKEEMRKYGLKLSSNKNMVKQLSQVWDFLNLSILLFFNFNLEILPDNLKKNLYKFVNEGEE